MSMRALASAKPRLAQSLSALSEVVEEEHLLERWPFPLGDKHVVLVLRQWIQEKPSETFANQLRDDHYWAETTGMLRELWERSKIVDRPDTSLNVSRLFKNVEDLLAQVHVSVSPANIGFTVAEIIGTVDSEMLPAPYRRLVMSHQSFGRPLPARGVLLTTLVFASLGLVENDEGSSNGSEAVWTVQPNANLNVAGEIALITGPFVQNELLSAMLAHRNYVQSLATHPFTDTSAIRKAQPKGRKPTLSPDDSTFDYVEEARREAQATMHPRSHYSGEWQFHNAMNRLLNRVQRRVAQRCKRVGRNATPPKGWRARARRLISRDLKL